MSRHKAMATLLVGLLTACDISVDERALPGLYVMTDGHAVDSILVRNDSTYRRTFSVPNAPTVTDTGRWSVHRRGGLQLAFADFHARVNEATGVGAPLNAPGFFLVEPVRRLGGTPRLMVNPDVGSAYERRGQQ